MTPIVVLTVSRISRSKEAGPADKIRTFVREFHMENQMNYRSEAEKCSLHAIAHSGQITVLKGPRIAGNENGSQTIEQAFQALLQQADLLVPPQNRQS